MLVKNPTYSTQRIAWNINVAPSTYFGSFLNYQSDQGLCENENTQCCPLDIDLTMECCPITTPPVFSTPIVSAPVVSVPIVPKPERITRRMNHSHTKHSHNNNRTSRTVS